MSLTPLLIKNGRILDPVNGIDAKFDLFIKDGKIAGVSPSLKVPDSEKITTIEASGRTIVPGLIDMHAHLRDPGSEDEETIESGAKAAARGGFTSVCCMANTQPPLDSPSLIEYVVTRAKENAIVNIFPIGAVTKGLAGKQLAEMGRMIEEGAVAFSDDGNPIMDAQVMRLALQYLSQFNKPLLVHAEDRNLAAGGAMNEGYVSTIIGLKGAPALAEELMIERDIGLAKKYGRIHICHVSTAGSVELIRQAKKNRVPITCETCPHYFTLTEETVMGYNTMAKVNPPLRTEDDVKAIVQGLADGTIDVIATDHAPHNIEEKNCEFDLAASGMVGLETALSLVLSELVSTKALSLNAAITKLTANPAKILNLPKGNLSVGAAADVTIIDLNRDVVIDTNEFASRSKNSPYDGWKLKGSAVMTIVGGQIAWRAG